MPDGNSPATIMEITMFKLKTKQEDTGLPEPVALTPDQLKEMAAMTAGGLSLVSNALIIRAGPYPPSAFLNVAAQNVVAQ
jgi:hypothetical protein